VAVKCYTGSFAVAENTAVTVTVKDIAALAGGFRQRISSVWIDGTNLTVDARLSVHVYLGAAGADKRHIEQYDMIITAGEAVNLLEAPIEIDTRIVFEINSSGIGAAGPVTCYYRIPYDDSIEKLQSVFNGTGATDDVDLEAQSLHIHNDTAKHAFHVTATNVGGYDALHLEGTSVALYGHGDGVGAYFEGEDAGLETNSPTIGTYFHGVGVANGWAVGGIAFKCTGFGTSHSIVVVGGNTSGRGIDITTTAGDGIKVLPGGNYIGLNVSGGGATGSAMVLDSLGGNALLCRSAGSEVVYFQGINNNPIALKLLGFGSGAGASIIGGATGNAILAQAAGNDAVKFEATAGNGSALVCSGFGAGRGISLGGGATGSALYATCIGNHAISILASGANKSGINVTGNGTGHGVLAVGGATSGIGIAAVGGGTGHGIYASSGGGLTGTGLYIESLATNGNAIYLKGIGTGHALQAVAGATGYGINITAAGGHGIYVSAAGAGMDGINVVSAANQAVALTAGGNAAGFRISGAGTGHGIHVTSGAGITGDAIYAAAASTNGNGARFAGIGTGHGFTMVMGAGVGAKDIDAKEIDDIGTSTTSIITLVNNVPTNAELNQAFQKVGGDQQSANSARIYIS
jgi:hypothetical protein